jgi:hypothetical protein
MSRFKTPILSLILAMSPLFGESPERAGTSRTKLDSPRLSFTQVSITGVAIVNPTPDEATVILTAFGKDGRILRGPKLTNPASNTIPARQQFADLSPSIRGLPEDPSSFAWFRLERQVEGVTGFFTVFNQVTSIDGTLCDPIPGIFFLPWLSSR